MTLGKLLSYIPDPLKWLDDALAVMRYGTGHKLTWYKAGGWNGAHVETMLNRYGILCYWRDYGHGGDTIGVHVPKAQAVWADYLLRKAGAPIEGPALSKAQFGPMPAEWGAPARPVGFAGVILSLVSPQQRTAKGKRRGGDD